ncbi:unnamed protein product [Leptosia nina]|uniref:Uncharacterized protein n=1 Tax=Leptosia nina TaxID=320188 RepID=A0AAV1K391_9NEOP
MWKSNKVSPDSQVLENIAYEVQQLSRPVDFNTLHHGNKVLALRRLKFLLEHSTRDRVQKCDMQELIYSSLSLVYYFGTRLKQEKLKGKLLICFSARQFHLAEEIFHKVMEGLHPEHSELVIKTTLKFFSEVSLWSFENFVTQILEVLLFYNEGKITLFNIMLTDIHCVVFSDLVSARHRTRVLYELLNSKNWVIDSQHLLPFVTRFLNFFTNSACHKRPTFQYLKKGFEVCLRRIFERTANKHKLTLITTILHWFTMVDIDKENVLDVSTLLDYAAFLYEVGRYRDSFEGGFIHHIVKKLIGSTDSLYSLCGCRILARFLDRHNNSSYLIVPTLYYEFSQVPLKVGDYDRSDKAFLRDHRELFHDYFVKAFEMYHSRQSNVEALYFAMSCLVLEVPCGFTAASVTCMLMFIQDFAITTDIPEKSRFWLHAVVLSLMSLICWVHKAPELYRYVNEIVSRRAKEAPQLNPPLLDDYKIENKRVTWNRDTLFFEDWELRYGLWKHFRSTQLLFCLAMFLAILASASGGRSKKVIIHVPYKVKKIRHTHTVYKTIHHHHKHHEFPNYLEHPSEEHEHFHHMLIDDAHTQPIPAIGLPDYLPDVPINDEDEMDGVPIIPTRHMFFKRE